MIPPWLYAFKPSRLFPAQGVAPTLKQDLKALAALLLLCGLLYGVGLNAYPLLDVDEPRYAQTAVEMLARNDWVVPYFNEELRLDKPPLIYWLNAFWFIVFGEPSAWAARLSAALPATLSVGLLFALGRYGAGWPTATAALCSAMAACSLHPIAIAHFATPDGLLSFCLLGTFASMALIFMKNNPKWWVAAGFFAGVGTLAKGPVAIVLPGACMLAYTLWNGDWGNHNWAAKQGGNTPSLLKTTFANEWFPLGLTTWFAMALPWFISAAKALGSTFWNALYLHNVARYQSNVSDHAQPFWFFIPVLLVGCLPWLPLLALLPGWLKQQPWFKVPWFRSSASPAPTSWSATQHLLGFMVTCSVGVLLFYSVGSSKLLTYILPAFAPLAVALGAMVSSFSPQTALSNRVWKWLGRGYTALLGLSLASLGFASVAFQKLGEWLALLPFAIEPLLVLFLLTVLSFGLWATVFYWRLGRGQEALLAQVLTVAALTPLVVTGILPSVAHSVDGGLAPSLQGLQATEPVGFYQGFRPSSVWVLNRRIQEWETPEQVLQAFTQQQAVKEPAACMQVLGKNHRLAELATVLRSALAGRHYQVTVLGNGARYGRLSVCNTAGS